MGESSLAILKGLLIASMACSTAWHLQASQDSESEEMLLSGLFVCLQMFDFLVLIDFDLTKVTSTNATLGKIWEKRKKLCRYPCLIYLFLLILPVLRIDGVNEVNVFIIHGY